MAKLLNVHRAARLVGVTRGALQKKILGGELESYDGMVTLDELQRAFPDITLENDLFLEQMEQIKDAAFGLRVMDRTLPDKEVLAARLHELSRELVESKSLLKHARDMLDGIDDQLEQYISLNSFDSKIAYKLRDWLHAQRMQTPPASLAERSLLIRDNFLRVISAQVKVLPTGFDFLVEGNDTILEASLRAGIPLSYGCANGSCGKCKARIISGEIKQMRPHEYVIPSTQLAQGYALMCSCTAVSDVVIEGDVAHNSVDIPEQQIRGEVRALDHPSDEVAIIHIKTLPSERLRFLAGQRAALTLANSLSTQLSIASCPCEDRHLEFHVRRHHGNFFADYVFDHLKSGDIVSIRGPLGNFVLKPESNRPIVFLAFCNGFAAVKSLMEHAMALDQAESIHLLWIATNEAGIYLRGLARAWADALDNFHFLPVIIGGDLDATASRQELAVARVLRPILLSISNLTHSDVYIAGPALATDAMRKILVLIGVPENHIYVESD